MPRSEFLTYLALPEPHADASRDATITNANAVSPRERAMHHCPTTSHPVYTLSRPALAKPARVIPAARAASTARLDGALTATAVAKPAAHAFCTISKLALPLT